MRLTILFCILFLTCSSIFGQEQAIPADSLIFKSYDELYASYNKHFENYDTGIVYALAYLNKGRFEGDTVRMANGFSQLSSIQPDSQEALRYADSIIVLTKPLKHDVYPGFGYLVKGICLFNLGSYEAALDNYLFAYEYASANNNLEQLIYLNNEIGQLKIFWGSYEEALSMFKNQLHLLNENQESLNDLQDLYSSAYFSLSNAYILNEKPDSAMHYANIGLLNNLRSGNMQRYYSFVGQTGIISYYNNNFGMTIDSLNKSRPYYSTSNDILNDHFYRALIHQKQGREKQAIYHFKKVDSIYDDSQDIVPEVRQTLEQLVSYYKNAKDIENQLFYIDKLLHIDSIVDINYKNLNSRITQNYDRPQLLAEKQELIDNLKLENKKSSLIIYVLVVLVLILIGFWHYNLRMRRIYKNRFERLISSNATSTNYDESKVKTIKNTSPPRGISADLFQSVLKSLSAFEDKEEYLSNKISLNLLAKKLGTNTNYLSRIINHYTGKNFSKYLTDLRIDYAVYRLRSDAVFRKYTIESIAQETGFNHAESFSKAFYAKTGLYPSFFIKEMEKQDLI